MGTPVNPVKEVWGDNCAEVYVWGAPIYIKEALKLNADITVYAQGPNGQERTLAHHAALRPIKKLPWPLSAIQAHHVEFSVTYDESAKRKFGSEDRRKVYSWDRIDEVIDAFLHNLPPDSTVRIMVL